MRHIRLGKARVIAMSFPGVTEEPHHDYTSFRVKGTRVFEAVPEERAQELPRARIPICD